WTISLTVSITLLLILFLLVQAPIHQLPRKNPASKAGDFRKNDEHVETKLPVQYKRAGFPTLRLGYR
ncbi:hypothetical protein AAZF84_20210, partial [Bacillus sp. JR_15]